MVEDDSKMPPVGETWAGRSGALTKGTIGASPVAGCLIGEVAGLPLHNQRLDRLEAYVRKLDERLSGVSRDELTARMQDRDRLDLFEVGGLQAWKAYAASAAVTL